MRIRLILVGRPERGHVADGLKHYLDRIRRMEGLEEVMVPDAGKGEPAWQQRTESERILAALRSGERVVVGEVSETWMVLGVARGRVSALHTMPRRDIASAPVSAIGAPASFAAWLKDTMEKRRGG